ncbi:unnamed protein product [Caenorhabditis sp. 36 PRJEB53466]|nr:unnamed protein product [Caenorhabditis sp. 36 PRJEB53466]
MENKTENAASVSSASTGAVPEQPKALNGIVAALPIADASVAVEEKKDIYDVMLELAVQYAEDTDPANQKK